MNNGKSPENEAPHSRLVPAEKRGDTNGMELSRVPNLEYVRRTLSDFPAHTSLPAGSDIMRKALWRASVSYRWLKMWRVTRNLEKILREYERDMRALLEQSRSQSAFYSIPAIEMERHCYLTSSDNDALDELERVLKTAANNYPSLGDRMRVVTVGFRRAKEYTKLFFPQSDPDLLREAERQYHDGELMDLETFINGVQRVR